MSDEKRQECDDRARDESSAPSIPARRFYAARPGYRKLARDASPEELRRSVASIPRIIDNRRQVQVVGPS